ncbi:hypothetical protein A5673_21325 [Mycobacterium sp. E3198]|nr:hypothetical protein A5673_21325 [Mycobacterium sp. E3198]
MTLDARQHHREREDDGVTPHAAPTTPRPGRKRTVALLAAVACAVLGAKLITIWILGSPMPFYDQWNGEAADLFSPYLRGTLSLNDLLAPHNEHRILVFRLFALAHLELAGEWNVRLEMVFGAIVHTAVIAWLAALLMPLVPIQRRMLLACFIAFLFALPMGYENTLWGFQSQVYLALLFGIAAVVAFAFARPFSARWFGGLAAAVLSYFSFATGVAAVLAVGALVGIQIATNARKRCAREIAGVVILTSIAVAMIVWAASIPHPVKVPWTSFIQGLCQFAALVGVGFIPMVWFCYHAVARRPRISDRVWIAVGISGWVTIQLVLLAYGRGTAIAARYLDIALLVYPVALMAVFASFDRVCVSRFSRFAKQGVVMWVFIVVTAFGALGYGLVLKAVAWGEGAHQQEINVQAYLATRNVADLKAKGGRGQAVDLSFPDPQRLASILADPDVRAILPREFRPTNSDNAGARSRMLLKGSLAGVTAGAVRLLPVVAPALLALGVGLFFAVGARLSIPGARR